MNNSDNIIKFYGITKDSKTNNFMMVMDYAENGNLRRKLNKDFNSLSWRDKILILHSITNGLRDIHKEGLTHRDFHSGNILNYNDTGTLITDLGLCKPANEEESDKTVYGVLPYVAPEVLRGKKYTQASDVYNFGIIIYNIFNNEIPPYHDVAHDEFLGIKICNGLRPKFNIKVSQLIEDLAKQCVDADPLKRPTAEYLFERIGQWYGNLDKRNSEFNEDSEIHKQIKEVDEFNEKQTIKPSNNTELSYETHPQAIYTSRLLNFNNLPEPKNADDEEEYSGFFFV